MMLFKESYQSSVIYMQVCPKDLFLDITISNGYK